VVSIGYPGVVVHGRPVAEPHNLGRGWVGFDYRRAFGRPVRIVNDAAMQALGSYRGGRMLFLGLGTGLGSAMIIDGVLEPMELAHLPYEKGRTYEDYVGLRGLRREVASYPPADITIERIGELLHYDLPALLDGAGGGKEREP
jgi:polyphosphate glucokinase